MRLLSVFLAVVPSRRGRLIIQVRGRETNDQERRNGDVPTVVFQIFSKG